MTQFHPVARAAGLGIAALAAMLLACGPTEEAAPPAESAVVLPDLLLETLGGEAVQLASLTGEKPLLLWFWAPW